MDHEDSYSFCKPYLANGEYILWRGKPERGNLLSSSDIYLIPFSLLWCGFAFFWEFNAIKDGPFFFALFGIPFVCMGIYIVIGRFFHMAWLRKRTYYVITNLKVIRFRNGKVDMQMGKGMPAVSVITHKDGNGTIRIGQPDPYRKNSFYMMGTTQVGFTLENIADVLKVQQILTQIATQ